MKQPINSKKLGANQFRDPITGKIQNLSQRFVVNPSKTGQNWIFEFENSHLFEFEVDRDQLIVNCAGNCNGVDGVIRIALSGKFVVNKEGDLKGRAKHMAMGTQAGSSDDSVGECHANFSFKSGAELISDLKQELAGGHECNEPAGPSFSSTFPSGWWRSPFVGSSLI
jgi:hypothetical protein